MKLPLCLGLSALAAALSLGCSNSDTKGTAAGSVAPATQESLTVPGPYQVATLELTLVDSSRSTPSNGTYPGASTRTLDTTVWYPTAGSGGAVASGGPFPIIQYAHGFTSSKTEASALKEHLASHGYIVVAPTFPLSTAAAPGGPTFKDLANQPGDLAFVVKEVKALTGAHADLGAAVDLTHQGVAGLSLGGATTLIAVYHPKLHLPDVQAAVAFAPASFFFGPALYVHALPTLIMNGSSDELVTFDSIVAGPQAYAPAPLQVAKVIGGTHVGFMGIDLKPPDGGNSDQLGCSAVQGALGTTVDVAAYQDLAAQLIDGADGGAVIIPSAEAGVSVCATKYAQTMSGDRQLELTKAGTLAHFEAIIRGRKDAAAYLQTSFDDQNDDIEVTRAR